MATNPIAHKHNYANRNVSLTKPNQQLNECLTFMNYKIFIEINKIIYCETATYIHRFQISFRIRRIYSNNNVRDI